MKVEVEQVHNGYIVRSADNHTWVFESLESVFNHILLLAEGRASTFKGDRYGEVMVERASHATRPG